MCLAGLIAYSSQCYIGHKSLDRAIDLYQKTYPGGSQDEFVFTFSPYYLDPKAPAIAIPWEERGPYRRRKLRRAKNVG